jgi:ATP-binding cassette subfamily F protein 3
LLHLHNITYAIGQRTLLDGVDWIINPGRRYALIGPNGVGKTTLLRIIHQEISPQDGRMTRPRDYRIGYLPQEQIAHEGGKVLPQVLTGRRELIELEERIRALHHELENGPENQSELLDQLASAEQRFDALGGYTIETEAKAILTGLGFRQQDFYREAAELSGGWRMRIHLAKLLLFNPDLLLLDEPSNHLDLPSLEWLEAYLLNFKGSVVIVSHDRFFIERLCQEIAELEKTKLTVYPGNYSFYEKSKQENIERSQKQWEQQKAERERQQQFIDRFRYKATKAVQVQSRIKKLANMEEIDRLTTASSGFHFALQVDRSSYRDVVKIESLSFRYDAEWVFENIDIEIFRGEKIALVGLNGAGKTTLTRLIVSELQPQRGSVTLGQRTTIGYYAQHQVDALRLESTAYEEVASSATNTQLPLLRSVLGLFGISGDDAFKKIAVLSGGEKARVSLAKMLLSGANFIIMDEPTSHLDMASREALEKALRAYEGTLLLISHDRYFLDKLVNRVIEVKNKNIKSYEGNYTDYLEKRQQNAPENITKKTGATEPATRKSRDQKRLEAEARQKVSKTRNELKKIVEVLECEIERLETQKSEMECRMADPHTYKNGEQVSQLRRDYAQVLKDIETAYKNWADVSVRYENLLGQLEKH